MSNSYEEGAASTGSSACPLRADAIRNRRSVIDDGLADLHRLGIELTEFRTGRTHPAQLSQ